MRYIIIIFIIGLLIFSGCESEKKEFPPPEGYSSWESYYAERDELKAENQKVTVNPPQTNFPTRSESEEPDLYLLKSWSGTGIKTTEPFTIDKTPWMIVWENDPEIFEGQSMGILQVYIYDINEPDVPLALAANSMDKEMDTSYIYQKGQFYLTINAANTDWSVSVFVEN